MVHQLVHTSGAWGVVQDKLTPWEQDNPWKWNIFGLIAIALCLSALLYHFVEEPARRWMRRMVPGKVVGRPADANIQPGESAGTKLHPIDAAREAVSARAV